MALSQSSLAALSGVSLPTIQNIEAGKANPSFDTLTALLKALGFELSITPIPFDPGVAVALGVPLSGDVAEVKANEALLTIESPVWITNLSRGLLSEREATAVIAFYMGLKDHYPDTYQKLHTDFLEKLLKDNRTNGRVIKLRRIALSLMSRYL
jgi:transcriptional regulator with XRE-family HTH domain